MCGYGRTILKTVYTSTLFFRYRNETLSNQMWHHFLHWILTWGNNGAFHLTHMFCIYFRQASRIETKFHQLTKHTFNPVYFWPHSLERCGIETVRETWVWEIATGQKLSLDLSQQSRRRQRRWELRSVAENVRGLYLIVRYRTSCLVVFYDNPLI